MGLVEVTEWQIYSVNLELVLSQSRRKHRLFYFHCGKNTVSTMGAHLARRYITETETEPDPAKPFGFDPEFGFDERKERGLCC